jgi:hypothetical protein
MAISDNRRLQPHPFSCFLLVVCALLCACHRGEEATIQVTLSSGENCRLTSTPSTGMTLAPITTPIAGARSLELNLAMVTGVTRQQRLKLSTVELRDGSRITGRLVGSLEGLGPDGPQAFPWDQVSRAALSWGTPPSPRTPGSGVWARIDGDGVEPLEIGEIEVLQGWVVKHGTHAYRKDTKVTDLLQLTVPRERVTRSEWEIPVWMLKRIEIFSSTTAVVVNLGSGQETRLEGRIGSDLRSYYGDATLKGSDARGRWTLSLFKMRRSVRRMAEDPAARQGSPRVSIELYSQPQRPSLGEVAVKQVATFTDWDGTTLDVVDTWFEQMRLRQGSSIRTLNPAEVVELRVFENPWPVYDRQQLEGQWLDAEVTMADGNRLTGALFDRFGYISCVGPAEIIVHYPSYAIRRLRVDAKIALHVISTPTL